MRAFFFLIVISTVLAYAENASEIRERAISYQEKGNLENAITLLNLALNSSPDSTLEAQIRSDLAESFLKLYEKTPQRAFLNWDFYLEMIHPDQLPESVRKLYTCWGSSHPAEVYQILEKHMSVLRDSDEPYDEFLFLAADLNQKMGNTEKEREFLIEIIENYGDRQAVSRASEKLYLSFLSSDDYEKAAEYLNKLPETADNLLRMVNILEKKGKIYEAEAYLRRAYELSSENQKLENGLLLLKLYHQLRQTENRISLCDQLLSIASPDVKPSLLLEKARIQQYEVNPYVLSEDNTYLNTYKNLNSAKASYQIILDMKNTDSPEFRAARLGMAEVCIGLMLYDKAEEQLNLLIKEAKTSVEALKAEKMLDSLKK